ncbi:LLM class flavin-dependent oxidoreductase [Kribbella catacumbae]|uniref:LLM class flavin-dependent oxidoreductase n=1 Tax=Kribbella catacumbae TaxID=460086 RepID=UPI00039CD5E0|nr:LLM class flavin-dependent oxidoreductase [Kribbella catacumbae]
MTSRAFRFGVVGSPDRSAEEWQQTVRRAADLGYKSVLMPDGLQLLSPFPTLAVAAMTADIRVGTFVAAAPLRTPRSAAWDAHTLSVLTGGRFDFGIGTGRPQVEQQATELGMPFGSAKERRDQVRETLDQLEKLDDDQHTPIMLAAGGPRMLALAAARADIVSLATPATAPREGSAGLLRSCASWPAREQTTSSWR